MSRGKKMLTKLQIQMVKSIPQRWAQRALITVATSVLLLAPLLSIWAQAETLPIQSESKKGVESPPLVGPTKLVVAPSEKVPVLPDSRPGFHSEPYAAWFDEICPSVRMEHLKVFKLTGMERRLVCGDQHDDDVGVPWKQVPPNEAAFFARAFLQARGYHEPTFIQDGTTLFIVPGAASQLKEFHLTGTAPGWVPPKKRLIKGRILNPKLLNELQGWGLTQIKNEGYACATASSQSDPFTGEVVVDLISGETKNITNLETTGDPGLNEAALDRYNAFRVGDLYRDYLVELTRRRTLEDGFLQSIILSTKCDPDGVRIVRDVLLGSAREVRVAAGGNSDLGPLFRITLRQNRIGAAASSAQVLLNVSYLRPTINEQTLETKYKWYYSKVEPRAYLQPQIVVDHRANQSQEESTATVKVLRGYGKEFASGSIDATAGPAWTDYNRMRGEGQKHDSLLYLATDAVWKRHDFEYFGTSPRTGEMLDASAFFSLNSLGAHYTAQKFQLIGEKLWSIQKIDPPLLILALRFNMSSVFSVGENDRFRLPPEFLVLAGGDNNLRGFTTNTLPRDSGNVGSLSALLGSFEVRLHKVILSRADVFSFLDSGSLGGANFQLRKPIFMSPGLGLRWESPIGVLRVYGAEGFTLAERSDEPTYGRKLRLGVTYGEEF
jgi:outer membrane translocation and assembly module TamA